MHYVIVRADLPAGSVAAQAVHAAGESAALGSTNDRPVPGTVAIVLAAPNQDALLGIEALLTRHSIPHHLVRECDGEAMSIGCAPTRNRAAIKRVLSSLPLYK